MLLSFLSRFDLNSVIFKYLPNICLIFFKYLPNICLIFFKYLPNIYLKYLKTKNLC